MCDLPQALLVSLLCLKPDQWARLTLGPTVTIEQNMRSTCVRGIYWFTSRLFILVASRVLIEASVADSYAGDLCSANQGYHHG